VGHDHRDKVKVRREPSQRPPSTLAHRAVKSGDIERGRRDVDQSEARVAHDKKLTVARKEEELRRKDASDEGAEA
jgi:hypothetical protein